MASHSAADYQLLLDMEQLEEEMARMIDHGELAETCQLQLTELEMLAAMFPNAGELKVIDPAAVAEMTEYVEGGLREPPARLDYTIAFQTGQGKLELSVHLPLDYPNVEPDVFVRSDGLNRSQSHSINQHLARHIQGLEPGQLYIGSVVSWLQENGDKYIRNELQIKDDSVEEEHPDQFTRLWIYSHHIYSKVKRRDMLELAKECSVTGFSLPGKPGIICVEGLASSTSDWWKRVKAWNWKRIMVKKKEVVDVEGRDPDTLRLFSVFEEINMAPVSRTGSREHRMDMGLFFQYLEDHNCAQVFKDYFGVSGRASTSRV
ncbi:RWD domain-containing protein 2A-like [Pollicipes pollicipes]|uniref:RWD domain-containing protein 2A-like n=1 Tax=Pollicipes pollicipes TaxID=41117 RepID=UPI001884FF5D|nr:RWD domain-containing protein 2A-like [Pollicipes pollicipes]XP_037083641.1 RWD domain-containing protein 2A-like [Pollicipes pollicipes]XP_037083642.1 RWD domain-containing protein 2A-like [Pollicipes pollicipes]XP_037086058.1 RWD domain-containing protein 2A-like [Pollicipes pollicipes]XP_037086059.1 RWD domain-containing protein 2A-like [Pollicipes pollicipes]XP_037086060.1 RWD domain-containing protein 2A-like [Pollicipes pollicipes]XP_037086061.1 RWD domain-containing protein 2A-like 